MVVRGQCWVNSPFVLFLLVFSRDLGLYRMLCLEGCPWELGIVPGKIGKGLGLELP